MEKLLKLIALLAKILCSIFLCFPFVFLVVVLVHQRFSNYDSYSLFSDIILTVFNLLMIWYINWAIWTKGIKRKIIMAVVMFCFWAFTALLTMGPD